MSCLRPQVSGPASLLRSSSGSAWRKGHPGGQVTRHFDWPKQAGGGLVVEVTVNRLTAGRCPCSYAVLAGPVSAQRAQLLHSEWCRQCRGTQDLHQRQAVRWTRPLLIRSLSFSLAQFWWRHSHTVRSSRGDVVWLTDRQAESHCHHPKSIKLICCRGGGGRAVSTGRRSPKETLEKGVGF